MRKKKAYKIVNKRDGEIIAREVTMADSFLMRLKGLLGKDSIEVEEGLILYPCSDIHCLGMKFSIDAIFLDKDQKVISCKESLVPGSRARVKEAKYVIELQAGLIKKKQVKNGDILVFERS